MLRIAPKHWYSWDFEVTQDSEHIADIDVSWWREKAEITIQGTSYNVYRQGLMSGAFVLESKDSELARAVKPSSLRRSFTLEYAG